MTPGELTRIEDTLRQAYGDVLEAVRRDNISADLPRSLQPVRSSRGAGRPGARLRWVVPIGAGAAVAVIGLVAGLILPHAVGQRPSLAAVPQHRAYVATVGAVIPVNLATDSALPPIKTGVPGVVVGAVMTPDGRTIYVATPRGYVVPVDTTTRKAGPPIRIGGVPQGMLMSPDGSTGYVIEPPYGVAIVDFALNRRAGFIKIHDAWHFALTPDGKTLYVASGLTVTPVDTASLTLQRPIQTSVDSRLSAIAVAPDGKTAYEAGDVQNQTVLVPVRTATNTALTPIRVTLTVFGNPIIFSPDSRATYFAQLFQGVTSYSLSTGTVSWRANLPRNHNSTYAITVSPDGKTIYALERGSTPALFAVNAATGRSREMRVPVAHAGYSPAELDISPDGKTLYVQSYKGAFGPESIVVPVDVATEQVGSLIPLPSWGDLVFGP